jgi:hypothetical protein
MKYIALIAVIGVLLLQWSGGISMASVGGSMTIGLALIVAAPAVGIHEAWTQKRGVLSWIVNIAVSFLGAFLVAPLGGMIIAILLSPFSGGSRSLAAAGGPVLSVALAGMAVMVVLGAWSALWIVNRWR